MMKKIFITILSVIAFGACDVLDTEPQTSLDGNTVLVDAASAEGILLGAYSTMQSDVYYGTEYVLNIDLIADNSVFEGFYDSQMEIDQKAVPFTNLWVTDIWVSIYRVINMANLLIDDVDGIDDPALDRDRVFGEAHAVRALAYFDLLRVYGEHFDTQSNYGIPLLISSIPDSDFNQIPDLPRATVAETYAQILSDLNTAIELTEGSSDTGTMNYWAALSLRARVNLYKKDYQAAWDDANEVITNGPFFLESNLDNLYFTTEASSESIFEVEFNDQDQSAFNTYTIRRNEYNVDISLLESFEEGDARANYFTVAQGRDKTNKYSDNTNSNNTKVIRLAELYLIRSEAATMNSNDPNTGLDDLNTIRNRAGLGSITSIATLEDYKDIILAERRAELNFEGHRFFDLVRLDKIGEVLDMEDFRKVFPIPRTELQVSPALVQNPGYESN
ncbi:RagB/SusD family nutrient uptake outer membrane protein [Namhaeicola litoreus]|uniref:RagB/SusD family nutrient uptake outer membrane protein n=1 Tax=Namhaeicola litoreus TaxID=1052145 RepID=A0ABW3Y529_9FLAO